MNTTLPPAQPNPSVSTPTLKANVSHNNDRRRRHTITRPDSALALLSDDMGDTDEDEEQQGTFDRISDILSNLIQEANDAVNSIEHERAQLLKQAGKSKSMHSLPTLPSPSRLPRPKSRASHTPNITRRHASSISSSSSNSSSSAIALFSTSLPPSPASTVTTLSRSPSPTVVKRPLSRQACPVRRSMTPRINTSKRASASSSIRLQGPVLESFKRLDSSMALVDSLSRDLATNQQHSSSSTSAPSAAHSRLTVLLLVPLLHIPHTLITMVFDSISSTSTTVLQFHPNNPSTTPASSSNITGMLAWAFFFTLTSLVVDRVVSTTNSGAQWVTTKAASRRLSLPGSYLAGRDTVSSNITAINDATIASTATTGTSTGTVPNATPVTVSVYRPIAHRRRRSTAANRSSIYRKRYQTHDNLRKNDDSRYCLDNFANRRRTQLPSTTTTTSITGFLRSTSKQPVLARRNSI